MSKQIRVLLADDHPLVRTGIRSAMQAEQDITLVGEAVNGFEAQHLCKSLLPDVLLLDLHMPGPHPAETITYVHTHCPTVNVVVLTAYDDDAYIKGLLSARIDGYVLKDEATESIAHAVRTVYNGGTWFSRTIVDKLMLGRSAVAMSAGPTLTERERQILAMIGCGFDNARIAADLHLAEQTVRNYVSRLYVTLGVKSRTEAAIWARDNHITP